ncbi:MAG: cytochrome c [Cyclobacteriaceae bacterium]
MIQFSQMRYLVIMLAVALINCGGKKEEKPSFSFEKKEEKADSSRASARIDLESKGVGPVEKVQLGQEIDSIMVGSGKATFEMKCTACHKLGKKFIGPPPNGILKRRAPEWVMNMILNPSEMVKKDALAKDLFMEFNGSPMSDQGLNEEEAREVLEYFRTLQ